MLLAVVAIVAGLALLVWSADRFVDGASATAFHAGMSPLLIGMLVIGFGTSAPEMVVSALAAYQGNPALALGNAYGSNITNIALILGITALIHPIAVHSQVVRRELPLLILVTLISVALLWDLQLSRLDAGILGLAFTAVMGWSVYSGIKSPNDELSAELSDQATSHLMPLKQAIFWLILGLVLLVVSSRVLVWGAVSIAQGLGVSDLIIGLTIVAVGTSLPELASAVAAARRGEHDLALGNVIGSNLFNTLAVVGIAAGIAPFAVDSAVLTRDMSVVTALTVGLLIIAYGWRGPGRINRVEASLLILSYAAYTGFLVWQIAVQA
jgi:cation:H+ antiporter